MVKLVEKLTLFLYSDDTRPLKAFLTTYRSFITPKELLDLLIFRFQMPKLINTTDDKELNRTFVSHVIVQFHSRSLSFHLSFHLEI